MTSTSKDKLTSPKDPNKDEDLIKDYSMSELELPGKEYSKFVPFLRCIFPREEFTLTG